ncbi:deoxyribonuclease-1 [Trichonephila inaurata madagascariensis]|uniref:Deoxyribonuclease-1 n=1 Tax=Trichonephila inaurata madagascariensis TaxID=2747483 RepID=A0A8X6XXT0_9ARAC|nr:deoxyribonuclease-1 [Trichonephila inaurata madagascariensis]
MWISYRTGLQNSCLLQVHRLKEVASKWCQRCAPSLYFWRPCAPLYRQKDSKYLMQISDRVGRGNIKEQYAYIYRNDKFKFLSDSVEGTTWFNQEVGNNETRVMEKSSDGSKQKIQKYLMQISDEVGEATLKQLQPLSTGDLDSMVFIGIHTQPKYASNETSALAKVYDYAVKTFKQENVMLMGDMNAACSNVRISDWDSIELWKRPEFTWLITHDYDTTLSVNCCHYDRIIIAGDELEDAVIRESEVGNNETRVMEKSSDGSKQKIQKYLMQISDEVGEATLKQLQPLSTASKTASVNLEPSLCLIIHDVRSKSLPSQLLSQKSTFGFQIQKKEISTELYSESSNGTSLLNNLRTLQSRYQQLISKEVTDAIVYKIEHGALHDVTSHDDLQHSSFSVRVFYDAAIKTTSVHYCVATTLN